MEFGGFPVYSASATAGNLSLFGLDPGQISNANSFSCPRGRLAGTGWLLMDRGSVDQLQSGVHELKLTKDLSLRNLLLVSSKTLFPNTRTGTLEDLLLCRIADVRHLLLLGSHIDRSYNVRSTVDTSRFFPETIRETDPDRPWSWCEILHDLWKQVRESVPESVRPLPVCLELPETLPSATLPNRYIFHDVSAWSALCDVVESIGMVMVYDPIRGEFSIADPQLPQPDYDSVDVGEVSFAEEHSDLLIGDSLRKTGGMTDRIPQNLRVVFRSLFPDSEKWRYVTDSTWTPDQVYSLDTFLSEHPELEVPQEWIASEAFRNLYDPAEAVFGSGGGSTPSNASDLTIRLNEVGRQFYGSRIRVQPNTRTFSGFLSVSPGSTCEMVTWSRYGAHQDASITEVSEGTPPLWKWTESQWDSRLFSNTDPSSSTSTTSTTTESGVVQIIPPPETKCSSDRCRWTSADGVVWTLEEDNCRTSTTTTTTTTTTSTTSTTTDGTSSSSTTDTTTWDGTCPCPSTTSTSTSTTSSSSTSSTTTEAECGCWCPTYPPSAPGDCTYTFCGDKENTELANCPYNSTTSTSTSTSSSSTSSTSETTWSGTTCDCDSPDGICEEDEKCRCHYSCVGGEWVLVEKIGPCHLYPGFCEGRYQGEPCGPCGEIWDSIGPVPLEPCGTPECSGKCTWEAVFWHDSETGEWVPGWIRSGPVSPYPCEIKTVEPGTQVCDNCVDGDGAFLACECDVPPPLPPGSYNPCVTYRTSTPCHFNRRPCGEPPPPPPKKDCCEESPESCACYCQKTSTTPGSTTTSTTTTTTPPCSGSCTFRWDSGTEQWNKEQDGCTSECPCPDPELPSSGDDCEIVQTPCVKPPPTTTTTTTTSSTSTTSTTTGETTTQGTTTTTQGTTTSTTQGTTQGTTTTSTTSTTTQGTTTQGTTTTTTDTTTSETTTTPTTTSTTSTTTAQLGSCCSPSPMSSSDCLDNVTEADCNQIGGTWCGASVQCTRPDGLCQFYCCDPGPGVCYPRVIGSNPCYGICAGGTYPIYSCSECTPTSTSTTSTTSDFV